MKNTNDENTQNGYDLVTTIVLINFILGMVSIGLFATLIVKGGNFMLSIF